MAFEQKLRKKCGECNTFRHLEITDHSLEEPLSLLEGRKPVNYGEPLANMQRRADKFEIPLSLALLLGKSLHMRVSRMLDHVLIQMSWQIFLLL